MDKKPQTSPLQVLHGRVRTLGTSVPAWDKGRKPEGTYVIAGKETQSTPPVAKTLNQLQKKYTRISQQEDGRKEDTQGDPEMKSCQ